MELPIDLIDNVFEYLYFREILSFINSCKSHISNFSTILWVRYKNYHGLEFLITNAMSWRNIREQCYLKSFKYVYSNILCICSRYIEDIVKLESQNCRLSKEIIKLKPNHINLNPIPCVCAYVCTCVLYMRVCVCVLCCVILRSVFF